MKTLMSAAAIALVSLALAAQADEGKPIAQGSKMANCNKQAHDKSGAERAAFMKACLAGHEVTQKENQQAAKCPEHGRRPKGCEGYITEQQRRDVTTKRCATEAQSIPAGDERRAFFDKCRKA